MPDSKIYWAIKSAPSALAFSASLGVVFAVGHHVFYNSLDDKAAPNTQYNVLGTYSITRQQINLAAGNVLAFVTKYWLSRAVSIAFQQIAWRKLRQNSYTIGTVDDILDILSNGLLCFSPALWKSFSDVMLMAVLYWLIPVISFITPSTLTVNMKGISNSSMQYVPQVDFTSLNFALVATDDAATPAFIYQGPQVAVQKAVILALTDGEIQPISPPSTNSSWELNFHAPAITCQAVNASLQQEITENIFDAINASYPASEVCGVTYGYISWIPDSSTSNGLLPFTNSSGNYSLRSGTVGPQGEQFMASDGFPYPTSYSPLSTMIAALPNMYTGLNFANCIGEKFALNDPTILECSLYNATYISNFTYVNGQQNINTKLPLQFLNDVGYIAGAGGVYPFSASWENNATASDVQNPSYNTTFAEMFAYQAVMDAFGMAILGTVANTNVALNAWALDATNTSVMTTVLLQTEELAFLQSVNQDHELSQSMRGGTWPGDSIMASTNSTMKLKDAIEEAFRNVTLSLIAQYTLQPNLSSPYAPGKVNVTITTFTNVYSYSRKVLWTAYGLAISFTLLCVGNGILAFISSGRRTYESKFSTILRTTRDVPLVDRSKQRHPEKDAETEAQRGFVQIHDDDRDGKSPLPSYLGRAEITVAPNDYNSIQDDVEETESREDHRVE